NPQHSIFFVGYANPETPAGRLRDAGTNGEVALDPDKPAQRVRCNIEQFQFSAHATREGLIDYAKKLSPGKIVLVHGDPPAVKWMRATLSAELPGLEVITLLITAKNRTTASRSCRKSSCAMCVRRSAMKWSIRRHA